MPPQSISALIVTYNSAPEIEACLDALLPQQVEAVALEVIVVDNASDDDTVERVAAYGDKVTLIRSPENVGFAAAMNEALRGATGDLVALVNPDCTPDEGCLQALYDHLVTTPGVGVAAALLRNPDGSPQAFARREVDAGVVAWDLTWLGRAADRRWRNDKGRRRRRYAGQFHPPVTEPVTVDCPAAACVLTWRTLVGNPLFDESLPLLFNDGALYRRLRLKGYRCDVVPAATATHGYGVSLARIPSARKRAEQVASLQTYARRHLPAGTSAAVSALLWLDAITSAAAAKLHPNRAVVAHAKGTLGGLGLPGGEPPWLARPLTPKARARLGARRLRGLPRLLAVAVTGAGRRSVVRQRIRWRAWLAGARVDVEIHPTADVAADLLVEVRRGTRARLMIGPAARVQPRVVVRLWAGTLEIGARCEVRYGACLTVKGHLKLEDRVYLSRNVNVHADGDLVLEWGAAIGENATILDTDHTFDDTVVHVLDRPVHHRPVRIGRGAFVGAGAVIMPGSRVGAGAVVAANSVVRGAVEPRQIVAGAPAQVVGSVGDAHDDRRQKTPD